MYKKPKYTRGLVSVHKTEIGEQLIDKVRRIVRENEPITDGAPTLYTPRDEGVIPSTNVRTDRFELACEGMDQVHRGKLARSKAKGETARKEAQAEAQSDSNIQREVEQSS